MQNAQPAQRSSPLLNTDLQWCCASHQSLHIGAVDPSLACLSSAQNLQSAHAALEQWPVGKAGSHQSAVQPCSRSSRTDFRWPHMSQAWQAHREHSVASVPHQTLQSTLLCASESPYADAQT